MSLLPLGRVCSFRCEFPESDFRTFAAENQYPLATNILRNANTEIVDGQYYPAEMSLEQIFGWWEGISDERPKIENYLSYWYGYSNFGGITLVYDLDQHLLYGFYSSN